MVFAGAKMHQIFAVELKRGDTIVYSLLCCWSSLADSTAHFSQQDLHVLGVACYIFIDVFSCSHTWVHLVWCIHSAPSETSLIRYLASFWMSVLGSGWS